MTSKNFILVFVLVVIVGAIAYFETSKTERIGTAPASDIAVDDSSMTKEAKEKIYERAKEISSPDGFINSDNISVRELIGKKVVLVDFWTYSCINCQRTTPYLNAWYEKYRGQGLEIIGVHTPEFEFEKKYENVKRAVQNLAIKYPVVLDNDYSTWTAYQNRYWPHKYLIDIDGFIVYDHIGEGDYEETEAKIQEALEERMKVLSIVGEITGGIAKPAGSEQIEAGAVKSPETYFGASRNQYLGNGIKQKTGLQTLTVPQDIEDNLLYLDGGWSFLDEYAENKSANARIVFRYDAKNVYFVAAADAPVKVRIFLDKKKIGEMTVNEEKLYTLIGGGGYGGHVLELLIENPGLKAFTFTFG